MNKVRIGVNGYGVIGKRVADEVALQNDMELIGVCDVISDWRIKMAVENEYAVCAFNNNFKNQMTASSIPINGNLDDLIAHSDLIMDCTPKNVAAQNVVTSQKQGLKFILQEFEKQETTDQLFSEEKSFTIGRGLVHHTLNASKKQRVKQGLVQIQHANSIHNGVKKWLSNVFFWGSTKYLQAYLNFRRIKEHLNDSQDWLRNFVPKTIESTDAMEKYRASASGMKNWYQRYFKIRASIIGDKAYAEATLIEKIKNQQDSYIYTPVKIAKGQSQWERHFNKVAGDLFSTAVSCIRQPRESFFNWLNRGEP